MVEKHYCRATVEITDIILNRNKLVVISVYCVRCAQCEIVLCLIVYFTQCIVS